MKKTSLSEAVRFHGHLGPWLVLGVRMGELACRRLGAQKYFGLDVRVWGAGHRPKSCLIDGLQLSTGATYGKGNIRKFDAPEVKVVFRDKRTGDSLACRLAGELAVELNNTTDHAANEKLARRLFRRQARRLFTII